uniref:anti-CRISPR protein AcrIIC4 n=1 Tax=Haemophilus parainfluenzae TaxID=729 RepID=UPI00201D2C64|nr:Chain A, anti-CRISPR protein AcrIIC4 [Haemophilus parainfluenzae]7F7P_B Chain B, anti-CRISPR protein AcrIIC4 [Haemophilus parainfluenzae]
MKITSSNFATIATSENFAKLSVLPKNHREPIKGLFKSAVEQFSSARDFFKNENYSKELAEKFNKEAVNEAVEKLQKAIDLAEKQGIQFLEHHHHHH